MLKKTKFLKGILLSTIVTNRINASDERNRIKASNERNRINASDERNRIKASNENFSKEDLAELIFMVLKLHQTFLSKGPESFKRKGFKPPEERFHSLSNPLSHLLFNSLFGSIIVVKGHEMLNREEFKFPGERHVKKEHSKTKIPDEITIKKIKEYEDESRGYSVQPSEEKILDGLLSLKGTGIFKRKVFESPEERNVKKEHSKTKIPDEITIKKIKEYEDESRGYSVQPSEEKRNMLDKTRTTLKDMNKASESMIAMPSMLNKYDSDQKKLIKKLVENEQKILNKDKKINELEKTIEVLKEEHKELKKTMEILKEEHKKKEEDFNNYIIDLKTKHTNEIAKIEKKYENNNEQDK